MPEPTPTPTPTPPPKPPPPADYQLNRLEYDLLDRDGKKDEPTVRIGESSWMWQREQVRIDGKTYSHGITVNSLSRVTIDLNRACTAYDALAGVDQLTLGNRSVRFSVLGDGAQLWESPMVRRNQPPVPVHVPLNGVETLQLVVQPRGPMGAAALADWANSEITCR
ncbi:NPCBM/NEW2 domain-containing protein [Streptomyces armeniacus]|uniref:NPCBM/NEW2 domain-containing protein n=1 Tax=Streptomyces armeniacus TaxID=83291 RepID=UPI001AD7F033|nr:NPCBM/NEW2 domain-containing protein [Streptomyces armeniacus]